MKEHPDLYRKSIKGGFWVSSLRLALLLLGFAKSIIILNFFVLENLGIIAIASMMMEVLSTFTQTGFDTALIQKKGNINAYLDTAWTAGLLKGAALFVILFLCAPLLALINVPEDKIDITISVLRAMAVCFLIRGIQNIGAIFFQKELEFGKVFAMTLASSLTDIVLSVFFIYIFRSIWGVVAARILSEMVHCTGSYLLSSYRPRFRFELAKARELWIFGKWIYGQSVVAYLLENGGNFFVWPFLGLPQLTLFRTANNFACMPATYINQVVSEISLPAYSKIQDDITRLREAYFKILKLTGFFAIPISFQIIMLGPDFVKLFLKPHLHPMTLALQILAIKGLLSVIGTTRGPLFTAIGRPDISWRLHWIRLVIMGVLIYPLTRWWGIEGTAAAIAAMPLIVNPISACYISRILHCSFSHLHEATIIPYAASAVMLLLIWLQKKYVFDGESYYSFFGNILTSMAMYLFLVYLMDVIFSSGFRQSFAEIFRSLRKKGSLTGIRPY